MDTCTPPPKKRKRSVLTLASKLEIISALKKDSSQRVVAEKFGVAKSTVCDIWRDRGKIDEHVAASDNTEFAKKHRIVRDVRFELLDQAAWTWFSQQRSSGAPVTGVLLQEKARLLFPQLYPDADPNAFKASSGWLQKFNKRHGIKDSALRGEILSADTSAIDPFVAELADLISREGYRGDQLFNADETGLWWRMTPARSLTRTGEQRHGNFKKAKDRVTLLACANAAGSHRLPMTLINSSKRLRCFKHMNMAALPVHYMAQKKSWMDSKLFTKWFHDVFVPDVKSFCLDNNVPYKVLLLLDNAPSHPGSSTLTSSDGCVKTMFLPPNTTSVIQPMDQGILESCKRRFKRKLLWHVLTENESSNMSVPDILKKVNMKDVVYWVAEAWKEGSNESLAKAWKKLLTASSDMPAVTEGDDVTENGISDDLPDLAGRNDSEDMRAVVDVWLGDDANDPGHQILTDQEIVVEILAHNDPSINVDSSDDEGDDNELVAEGKEVTPQQAFEALGARFH